jgi:hypothetical protein
MVHGAVGASIFCNHFPMANATPGFQGEPSIPAAPAFKPSVAELPILEATLELIRWFIPILHCLPRQQRFGLGDRLIANLYELMEQLALARFQRERLPILEPLAGRLHLIQLQTRLLHEFNLIDLRRYEHASRLIAAIGRQLSGWLSQQRQAAPAPGSPA